jgi:hypothetical protein
MKQFINFFFSIFFKNFINKSLNQFKKIITICLVLDLKIGMENQLTKKYQIN